MRVYVLGAVIHTTSTERNNVSVYRAVCIGAKGRSASGQKWDIFFSATPKACKVQLAYCATAASHTTSCHYILMWDA